MKQFVVPQFIDVENKILGPITVRQFTLLLIALLVSVVMYKITDFTLFAFVTVMNFGFAAFFSFVKVNGRPVHYLLLGLLQTMRTPKIRVWNKNFSDIEIKNRMRQKKNKEEKVVPIAPKIIQKSKLSELSLVVDTGGRYRFTEEIHLNKNNKVINID